MALEHHQTMKKRDEAVTLILMAILLLIFFVVMSIGNYSFSEKNPGGADFVPRWLGVRLLLTEKVNPYSDEATEKIQEFIYGREARDDEDQVLFVYPLYSFIFFAPYSMLSNYNLARALWLTTLEVAIILITIFSLYLANWKPPPGLLAVLILFALFWYHGLRPLINGNPSILAAFFTISALLAIRNEHDVLAGILLGFATIKPQVIVLLLPLIIIWAISRRRLRLIASTAATVGILIVFATAMMPGWIGQNLAQISAYPTYTLASSPRAVFEEWWSEIGSQLGTILTVLLVLILFWQWRKAWKQDFQILFPIVMITLVITTMVGIATATANYIVLFPGLILIFSTWESNSPRYGRGLVLLTIFILFIGLWILFFSTLNGRTQSPVMFFPIPIFLLIMLLITFHKPVGIGQYESKRKYL